MGFTKKIYLILLLHLSFYNLKGQDRLTSKQSENLEAYLEYIHGQKGFSGEILISNSNSTLFQRGIGLASIEYNIPIKPNAKYKIASITKTFTATLIVKAKEEGKLNFEDPASKFIPKLDRKFKAISIHQLLTHTSGLPHNQAIADYWLVKSKLSMTTDQVISEINQVNLLFESGTQLHYSSLGYFLLATILEKVYQENYDQVLKTKILNLLNMTSTGSTNSLSIIPEMTNGYHLINDDSLVVAPYRNYSMLKGAGDLYSNSTDLLKWASAMLNNQLATETSSFIPNGDFKDNSGRQYGYGWFIESDDYLKYSHGGGTWGYSSILSLYPKTKTSIIVLSNVSTLPTEAILKGIENIIFKEDFEVPKMQIEITSNPAEVEKYVGSYISDSGQMKLNIVQDENGLLAQLAGNPPFQIYPKGEHQFFGKKVEILISFKRIDGKTIGLTAERMGQKFEFKKQ